MRMLRRNIVLALCSLCITAWGAYSYIPTYLAGKMNKHLKKTYGVEVTTTELDIPDSLTMNHQLFAVNSSDTLVGYAMITRALGCRLGGCDKPNSGDEGFEQFFFMTAFDLDRNIRRVRILEYTSNYGYQIANKGWLRQFERDEHFEVNKNVDGISGATVSVQSITKAVNQQVGIITRTF